MLVALLFACSTPTPSGAGADSAGGDSAADTADSAADTAPGPEETCAEVDAFGAQFTADIARFTTEDDLAPPAPGAVVFVGSSSIRRWEGLAEAYADHAVLQRGVGGAQLGEIAQAAEALALRHDPAAIVVYAGTNDVSAGVDSSVVVERFRCFRERAARALGADRPVLFVAITPNPSRWEQWAAAQAVNDAVAAIAAADAGVVYVDVATPFLATGSPPAARLFAADGLHLSAEGYALWDSVLRPAIDAVVAPRAAVPAGTGTLAAGTRILVDLGPQNAEDGEPTPSPDHLGQAWNNWPYAEGDGTLLPGEHLDALVDSAGARTGVSLTLTGGFGLNGRQNGGLLWPDSALLGDLAVGSATGDYGFATDDDVTGGLVFRGLDPGQACTLRLFAAREEAERRVTTYTARGATTATGALQTSGSGAGSGSAPTNDDTVLELAGLRPDAWGNLFVDVARTEGTFAYLAVVELRAGG